MRVSILIPCFNAERWVSQAIESALAQTCVNKEVIVVDDGSTDNSLAIIKSFGDQILWETGPNRGGNAARNRLLHLTQGDWLQYLDADDYLLPEKIDDQLKELKAYPDSDVIYSPALFEEWIDDRGPGPLRAFPLPEPHDPWVHLAYWRLPQTGGALWRRATVLEVGGWNESLRCCQEHELYLRLLESGARFVHCGRSGAVYRYWPGATVSRRDPYLVDLTRLDVLERMSQFLVRTDALTAARLRAVNTTRFAIARALWAVNRPLAISTADTVMSSERTFVPVAPSVSRIYSRLYRLLGFRAVETIAMLARPLTLRSRPDNASAAVL